MPRRCTARIWRCSGKKDVEVLLLTDRVDEWLVSHLHDYSRQTLQSVAKGQLDLGELEEKEREEQQKIPEEHQV